MTLQQQVKYLLANGFTQDQLAIAVPTSQPTISRVEAGGDTKYSIGKRIEELYEQHIKQSVNE